MIIFQFTVCDSFLDKSTHPITVPSSQINYETLKSAKLHEGDFNIIFPCGENIRGKMNTGIAGYGRYYQIRKKPRSTGKIPEYIKINDRLIVILFRLNQKNYAVIEYEK